MVKKYFAEFFGTFLIVVVGCGAIVLSQEYQGTISHFEISLAFGAIVCSAIYGFKNLSTHFNPAVSITLYVHKQLSFKHTVFYVFFQCLGGMIAAVLLKKLFYKNEFIGATIPSGSLLQSFGLECFFTFLLVVLIFILDKKPTKLAGLIIGFLIFLEAYIGGHISGSSMNPARSIGPAIVSGHTEYLWVYIFAPITGGLAALFVFKNILRKSTATSFCK